MKRVFTIFGTRPEAIKLAPIILELRKLRNHIETLVCVTGQHREMLDQILENFGIVPDLDFEIMRENQSLGEITTLVMAGLTKVFQRDRPDLIMIQGDTTTAMVAALAGFYEKIPIGHVEAGLRTGDRYYPFPEEINRRLISVLSTYHFAPTQRAADALVMEKIDEKNVFVTGNTVVDALYLILKDTTRKAHFPHDDGLVILVTAHRRENFGKPMTGICQALKILVRNHQDIRVVFPVHRNPNVRKTVYEMLAGQDRILLLNPLDYLEFVRFLDRSYIILTDSGGVQEEAAVLGKPVLVLRNETERMEGVTAGIAKIVGTDPERIVRCAEELIHNTTTYEKMARKKCLYGDGRASEKIVEILLQILDSSPL